MPRRRLYPISPLLFRHLALFSPRQAEELRREGFVLRTEAQSDPSELTMEFVTQE